MDEVQCTKWFKKNMVLRLGKAVFAKPRGENYSVPNPVRKIPVRRWLEERARIVQGYIRERKGEIAVFRLMKKGWARKF